MLTGQPALVWTNIVLTVLNIFGIWRWLGRQSRVEEGACTAAQVSEAAPGETLFPMSLCSATLMIDCAGQEVGHCIDAMAGCASGRLNYLVAPQGGRGGRRRNAAPAVVEHARVEEERVTVSISGPEFDRLERIGPGRMAGPLIVTAQLARRTTPGSIGLRRPLSGRSATSCRRI